MWEERKRRENTTQGDDIHLRQGAKRGGLLFKKKLIEKPSNVRHQTSREIWLLIIHSSVHTAISAGSSWLLYVERHNMVTMVTYVEEQTGNGRDDIIRKG